jgi:hypothetical protein
MDSEGWEYNILFQKKKWHIPKNAGDFVRRRIWIKTVQRIKFD